MTPRPYSSQRLMGFCLRTLPTDDNGMPGGSEYCQFLTTREMRAVNSLRANDSGAWSGRRHDFASYAEYCIFRALEGNPAIMDIREQYPFASPEVLAALFKGEVVPRNHVLTVDFVVTLAPRTFGGPLRYHVLSHKSAHQRDAEQGKRRRVREEQHTHGLGWSWHYVERPPRTSVYNHEKLHGWCSARGLDEAWVRSRDLACLFYRTTSTKTLRGQLAMFARRLHISEEDQWFVFAAAYYLGFIALDHAHLLDEDAVLVLQKPRHG